MRASAWTYKSLHGYICSHICYDYTSGKTTSIICFIYVLVSRCQTSLVTIMLLKLPIMLWSNAPEFYLLCSFYAPHVKHYALEIQRFISLIILKLQLLVLLQSSTQLTIHLTRTYMNTLNSFLLHLPLNLIHTLFWRNH